MDGKQKVLAIAFLIDTFLVALIWHKFYFSKEDTSNIVTMTYDVSSEERAGIDYDGYNFYIEGMDFGVMTIDFYIEVENEEEKKERFLVDGMVYNNEKIIQNGHCSFLVESNTNNLKKHLLEDVKANGRIEAYFLITLRGDAPATYYKLQGDDLTEILGEEKEEIESIPDNHEIGLLAWNVSEKQH